MKQQYQPRVVEVTARKPAGDFEQATGYAITRNRILTTAHVLRDGTDIQVRFLAKSRKAISATKLWESHPERPEVGIAVLEVAPSEVPVLDIGMEPVLSLRVPNFHENWVSHGIFRAGCEDDEAGNHESIIDNFSGTLLAPVDAVMTLNVESSLEDPNGWEGASGSAVFVGSELVAVVQFCPEAWKARRLKATCLGCLANNPEFLDAVGLEREPSNLGRTVAEVTEKLEAFGTLNSMLANKLTVADGKPQSVAERLCGMCADELLKKCNEVLEQLIGAHAVQSKRQDCAAAETLEAIVELILPLRLRPELTSALRRLERSDQHAILPLEWSLRQLGGVQMAALDDAEATLVKDSNCDDPLRERYDFPPKPEIGFGTRKRKAADIGAFEIVKDLAIKLLPEALRSSVDDDELARRVNRALSLNFDSQVGHARHWYLLFKDEQDRPCVKRLKDLVPNLRIGYLQGGNWEAEYSLFSLLGQFCVLKERRAALQ